VPLVQKIERRRPPIADPDDYGQCAGCGSVDGSDQGDDS